MRTGWLGPSLRALVLLVLLAATVPLAAIAEAQVGPPQDPAARHPGFRDFVRQYPNDWYQRLDPAVKPIADVQRMVGDHALVVGFSDEAPNPQYTKPRVVVAVAFHDGTDLYATGLPRVWPNGKPVVVRYGKDIPHAAAWCDKLRPAKGGLSLSNRRTTRSGTLGVAVYGNGWPTNQGWKYALSAQHVLADSSGGIAGDIILQPAGECVGNEQIGSLISIPDSLKLHYAQSPANADTQDSALAPLVSHDALAAEVIGIGVPAGSYDPPQNGWCGNKSGAMTGVTGGCITMYPSTWYIGFYPGMNGYLKDMFDGGTRAQGGDSGSVWFDYDRRAHGLLNATWAGNDTDGLFGRMQHVLNAWNISIATQ